MRSLSECLAFVFFNQVSLSVLTIRGSKTQLKQLMKVELCDVFVSICSRINDCLLFVDVCL